MSSLDETIVGRLQGHFSDALVTVVGSGHSASLGIPNMASLAEALICEMPNRPGGTSDAWLRVASELADGVNLEAALNSLPLDSDLLPELVDIAATCIGTAESAVMAEILEGSRRLAFAELLRHIAFASHPQIITTNYDRLVELAVEMAGYALDCSFLGMHVGPFDPRASLASLRCEASPKGKTVRMRYRRHVRLHKPHGSLDWYIREKAPFRTPYSVNLPRLMITPGASKYLLGYERPFDSHREAANRAIDDAARFLTLGYGFNDAHLQTHLAPRILAGAPTLVLARTLSDAARDLVAKSPNAIALERSASHGTLIHIGAARSEVAADLWSLDGFIDEVFA